jgi:hypothetical protein
MYSAALRVTGGLIVTGNANSGHRLQARLASGNVPTPEPEMTPPSGGGFGQEGRCRRRRWAIDPDSCSRPTNNSNQAPATGMVKAEKLADEGRTRRWVRHLLAGCHIESSPGSSLKGDCCMPAVIQ